MSFVGVGLKEFLSMYYSDIRDKESTSRAVSEPRKGASIVKSVPGVVKLFLIMGNKNY